MRLLRKMNTRLTLDTFVELIHRNKKNVEEFVHYMEDTSLIEILTKIDFNARSQKFHQSLFEFILTSKKYDTLANIILERIPPTRLDITNMKRANIKKLATILVHKETSFLAEKLKNIIGFNLNAICDRKQSTLIFKIVKFAARRPDVLIEILTTLDLKNVNFNASQKKFFNNDTVLSSIIKVAVEMETPSVIDALLLNAPFRNLDFITPRKLSISLQSKNIIDWLYHTKFKYYVPKILEAGIYQAKAIWSDLVKNLEGAEDCNRNFKIFKEHLAKLETFTSSAQNTQCSQILSKFYQRIFTETKHENPNLSALRNFVLNFSLALREKTNDFQPLNDFYNTLEFENLSLRKEITLTFAYRCKENVLPHMNTTSRARIKKWQE